MSGKSLGLDIGPTSVGWALVDEAENNIIAAGVRVFPEGVDRDQQGGEKAKNQVRRESRGARRQIARRARRRRQLRRLLTDTGLLPSDTAQLEQVLADNPYPLRRRALYEPLTPFEIGRVLVHLNQRRGFLSNRKTDKARDKETKGMLAEIGELGAKLQQTGSATLGEYLAGLADSFQHAAPGDGPHIRRRHTRRDMYEQEFDAIWAAQREHHPELLTEELKKRARRIIFFQRRIYWPKSVVGRCELEPKHKRCPRADRAAQRFRMLQEVNNLRFMDVTVLRERPLSEEERRTLVAYLAEAKQRTFDQIRKKLGLPETARFNLERAERSKLQGNETDAALGAKKTVGKRWKALPEDTKDAIVEVLLEEEQEDEALRSLTALGLTAQEAEGALGAHLADGYMSLSRVAIDKLLPHLERGLLLMADDASNSALHAAGYLRPDEREVNQRTHLPPAPELPNPIVRQALVEVRKVVNAIIREHGRPERIHVELAREAKHSFAQRRDIRIQNAKRRREREEAAARIEKLGIKPTRRTINRYLLWREQAEDCPYCGDKIGQADLFNGDADVDHILPRWRSLDDSLANRVIAHRKCNAEKGDRTPREWLEYSDPERFERMMRLARKLPYNKLRRFQQEDVQLENFVNRQLTDTAYISRCVTQYLRCLGATIGCPRGQMTADLRHYWGLNTILDPEGRNEKNRADHRHHAIDALVIAMTDAKRLHAVANARGHEVPMPWERFRLNAAEAISNICVSHRTLRRLSGALHEATLYGATRKPAARTGEPGGLDRPWAAGWVEDEHTFVRRKPVTELTNTKHLAKVRDPVIREILAQHLRDKGIDPTRPGKLPSDTFKGSNTPRMPSGVPIKRVRMLEKSATFRQVSPRRHYQYVKPGNNHHIVYRVPADHPDGTWTAEVVTMWDAALRARNGQPVVERRDTPAGRFLMSLALGEMFEIDGENGQRLLCVVRKIRQDDGRVYYVLHTDARTAAEKEKDNLYARPSRMGQRHACKVTVDPLGRVRRAND